MAKHKIGKSVSKGQRRSSINAGVNKVSATTVPKTTSRAERRKAGNCLNAAIMNPVTHVATTMREAFLNITVARYDANARDVVDTILTCAKQNSGNNKIGRGWTANLTPATVKKLVKEGVFA